MFRIARVFGQLIWKFQPDLTVSIFNFFSPSNNSTNWCYLRLTAQPYWPPDKLKHVAGETDILAIKTAEISRRQKKTKQSWGKYICPNHKIMTFLFLFWFPSFKKCCRSHSYNSSECPIYTICQSENDPLVTHFCYETWKPGGLGAPPGPPFDELAQICWYYRIESQVLRFIICNLFSEFWKIKKFFCKKR